MIKRIINQQKEERNMLLGLPYIHRLEDDAIAHWLGTSLIKLITGPRRSGKSVLALQLLQDQHFAYLNFDDDLLLKNFNEDAVIQALQEIYANFNYLLLDEIQNLPGWELWVNKLYRRGVNLVITGSNAKLLSHEMATSLTGRYLQISVFPFSFAEVLKYHEVSVPQQAVQTPLNLGNILHLLDTYLHDGGFPETVLNPVILKNYLSSLFDSILLKDILKRFRIRQTQQLYDLSNYLLANYTNLYSCNQLKNDLNFNSVATVQKFVSYLEEPYLLLNLTRYAAKIKTRQKSPVKTYVIDNGFIKARSFELSPNTGRLLENAVFVELLRRNYRPGLELFYYRTRNDKEVDFILRKGHTVVQLIQVCHSMANSKTLKRETDALTETASELDCNNLMLITWDREETIEKNGREIKIVPAWQWMINHVPEPAAN
jgi:predicted AAA+ superfamily ATPase